jgi:phospholipase/lecithinase/hemolysin
MQRQSRTRPFHCLAWAVALAAVLALGGCGGGSSGSGDADDPVDDPTEQTAATAYVLGASYESLNPNVTASPVGTGDTAGDATSTNGDTWVAWWATATNRDKPISSSLSDGSGRTATNYARGGAEIIDSQGGTGGIDRPRDAGEQYDQLESDLAAEGPAAGDVFIISAFGNDLAYKYEAGASAEVTEAFIDNRIAEIKSLTESAIALGFEHIVLGNMPPLARLPASSLLPSSQRNDLEADVADYNADFDALIGDLSRTHPTVTFHVADLAGVIATVAASPGAYGFVDASSTLYDENGDATGNDPGSVMWWDPLHPTEALHQVIADDVSEY